MAEDQTAQRDEGQWVPNYGVALTGDGPSLLADLRSIEHDLRYASRLFARVAEVDAEQDPDLRQALSDAGAIAYRRGFTTGRSILTKGRSRARVPDEIIDSLDDEDRRAHEAVLERANTHIAHRVSDAEQGRVILILDNPVLGAAVAGVAWFSARFVGPSQEDAQRDAANAAKLADSIGAFLEVVQGSILEEMRGHSLEDLYAAANPMGEDPSPPESAS